MRFDFSVFNDKPETLEKTLRGVLPYQIRGALERNADPFPEAALRTGVSPITMDDVTSGFNIGRNVTLNPELNDMLGFTEPAVVFHGWELAACEAVKQ